MGDVCVSVIIPVYNTDSYLNKCLDSVLSQTLRNIEVICVDDGSTDDSVNILREYKRIDQRVKIVHQDRKGAAIARNKAIKMARGEFVAFVDSDDWYPNANSLALLYDNAKKNKVKISGGSFSEYDSRSGAVVENYKGRGHLESYQFFNDGLMKYKDWQSDIGWIRFIYNRKFLIENKIEFPDLTRHEDPVFLVKVMVAAKTFYATKEVVYRYRIFYKKGELSQQNIDDAMMGISINMVIAQENNLDILKKWCYETIHWYNTLSPDYRSKVSDLELLQGELSDERDKNSKISAQLAATNGELDFTKQEIQRILNSKAYKIGYAITYPIRLIRKLMHQRSVSEK